MIKDFLAFLGLVFLTLLILIGVIIVGHLYTTFNLISLPDEFTSWSGLTSISPIDMPELESVEWSNPLEALETATLPPFKTNTPVPTLTPSPIPPLDPAVYRSEVIDRLRRFVSALETWRDLNNQLVKDSSLASDPAWLDEMKISLQVIVITGSGLAEVGPPPQEFTTIDTWLDRIPAQADGLQTTYLDALRKGDTETYLLAGDHFARIKEALAGAVEEMLVLGWLVE